MRILCIKLKYIFEPNLACRRFDLDLKNHLTNAEYLSNIRLLHYMVQDVNITTKFRTDAILTTARFKDATLVAILSKDRPIRRLFGWKIRHCTHS